MSLFLRTAGLGFLGLGAVALAGCTDDPYCFTCGQPHDEDASVTETGPTETGPTETGGEGGDGASTDAAESGAPECPPGMGNCNGFTFDGCEANLQTDPLNCGGCSQACALAHATTDCKAGKCAVKSCDVGWNDCDQDPSNGCESDTSKDPDNCGGCGKPCDRPANSTAQCVGGACAGFSCIKGFENCDTDAANGCEVSLLTDPLNCGACANTCAAVTHGQPGCDQGVCGVGTCDTGWDDCDKSYWSGCETELAVSVNHCGMCGKQCAAIAHGAAKCEGSLCLVDSCDPGFADCNAIPTDGCEVDLATDKGNCGACDNACAAIDHGTPGCSMFLCGIASCDPGWQDCFGGASDGCETDTVNDVDHCGTCTTVCPAVADGYRTCDQGVCKIGSCDASHEDCNGVLADGCEATLTSDINNCGACGNVCAPPPNAAAGCIGGACDIGQCTGGFANCNGDLGDGCEKSVTDDPANCGGCGVVCGSGVCAAGACVCTLKLLVIPDDSTAGTQTLVDAFTTGGLLPGWTVDIATKASYLYDGASPALTDYGSVLVLAGGPTSTSYSNDMPAAGQQAISNFVAASNGLVLTEWAAKHVADGRWATLAPLVLLTRTVAFSGQVTYKLDTGYIGHPIWDGLPGSSVNYSFVFASTSNVGVTKVASGVRRIVGSNEAIDAVAIRDLPDAGRVVHVAHAGNYAPNGWTNTNIQRLMANAVRWSARCN